MWRRRPSADGADRTDARVDQEASRSSDKNATRAKATTPLLWFGRAPYNQNPVIERRRIPGTGAALGGSRRTNTAPGVSTLATNPEWHQTGASRTIIATGAKRRAVAEPIGASVAWLLGGRPEGWEPRPPMHTSGNPVLGGYEDRRSPTPPPYPRPTPSPKVGIGRGPQVEVPGKEPCVPNAVSARWGTAPSR